ncbi:O-antigen ligase family protein [Vibrio fluvialis]|uniref:O-antigen ligase family protein n=1 Tax=Vibrio fluvialis TaxID=676 RepID=UPI0005C8BB5E|nr:O-antigen ligase family protein [Vibrio fluvialis]
MSNLLLLYSLLPGLSKIFDSSIFFALNLLIILILFYRGSYDKLNINRLAFSAVFLMLLIFQIFVSFISNSNFMFESFYSSFYIWIIPILGIYLADIYDKDELCKAMVKVSIVHSLIGFVIYGFFPLPSFLQFYANKLLEGVAYFRMSSVAGSLIFSSIVSCGFNCHIYLMHEKVKSSNINYLDWITLVLLFLAVLLSLQRSAWIAILPALLLFTLSNKKVFIFISIISVPIFTLISWFVFNNDFYYTRLMTLFSSDYNPVDERFGIWLNGIEQFSNNIFGLGIGQSGQFAYKAGVSIKHYITDGDYIKIVSEGGLIFLFFYLLISLNVIRVFFKKIKYDLLGSSFLLFIVTGFYLQMIGSNISEYYFVNFVFWVFIGVFCHNDRKIR